MIERGSAMIGDCRYRGGGPPVIEVIVLKSGRLPLYRVEAVPSENNTPKQRRTPAEIRLHIVTFEVMVLAPADPPAPGGIFGLDAVLPAVFVLGPAARASCATKKKETGRHD